MAGPDRSKAGTNRDRPGTMPAEGRITIRKVLRALREYLIPGTPAGDKGLTLYGTIRFPDAAPESDVAASASSELLRYDQVFPTLTDLASDINLFAAPQYLVGATSTDLDNERLVTDTASVTWDLATAGQAKANVAGKADDGDVTASGLTMSTARLLGRTTASTGAIEELTVGSYLALSGGTLALSDDTKSVIDYATRVLDGENTTGGSSSPIRTVSSTSYTSVGQLVIPGGILSTAGARVVAEWECDVLQNSGSSQLPKSRIYVGATSYFNGAGGGVLGNNASRCHLKIEMELSAIGTNEQRLQFRAFFGEQYSAGGYFCDPSGNVGGGYAFFTETASSDITIDFQFAWNTSATSSDVRLWHSKLTYYPAPP